MNTVYLCGGINGLSDADCKDWRTFAKRELFTFRVLDPMDRDYRGNEMENAAAIVAGDLADIDASDALLVKADRPSWGTAMEAFYAHRAGKVVVLFGVSRAKASPWLVHHCSAICDDIRGAIVYLMSLRHE